MSLAVFQFEGTTLLSRSEFRPEESRMKQRRQLIRQPWRDEKIHDNGFSCPMHILATAVTKLQQTSATVATKPRMEILVMIGRAIVPLIFGIVLLSAGIGLVEGMLIPGLGVVLVLVVILGVASFAASYASRRELSLSYLPEASTVLALYVAVEFLAGAGLAFIGISNLIFDVKGLDWSLAAITVFGLLLVTDSFLLYRRDMKQDVGKKKDV